ncbi:MAG: site-2 protease family protein, partial [Oscillospiraceae bacterium]
MGIIYTILIFGLIIFIHELGHFLVAKASGVTVHEFALGMGPTILKHQGKNTKYALRLLPIGGFVQMEGEDSQSDDEKAFCKKPIYKKMAIVVAGAVMNLLLGFVIMVVFYAATPIVGDNET